MAIEALEKQIPKKVEWGKTAKVRNRNTVTWVCPVCRYHVTSEYCRKCGQAIKWE